MKYNILIIALLLNGACFGQQLRPLKVDILTKSKYSDTISFQVVNNSDEKQDFNVSLEVCDKNEWKEVYDNIFQKDRDFIQNFTLGPSGIQQFKFSSLDIHEHYRKLHRGKKFRFVVNIFPANPLEGVLRIPSESFKLKF
jgi:hypothetical protein